MIGIASSVPPKSASNHSRCEFIRQTITVASAPTAADVFTDLMISALDIPGSARGKANAW